MTWAAHAYVRSMLIWLLCLPEDDACTRRAVTSGGSTITCSWSLLFHTAVSHCLVKWKCMYKVLSAREHHSNIVEHGHTWFHRCLFWTSNVIYVLSGMKSIDEILLIDADSPLRNRWIDTIPILKICLTAPMVGIIWWETRLFGTFHFFSSYPRISFWGVNIYMCYMYKSIL